MLYNCTISSLVRRRYQVYLNLNVQVQVESKSKSKSSLMIMSILKSANLQLKSKSSVSHTTLVCKEVYTTLKSVLNIRTHNDELYVMKCTLIDNFPFLSGLCHSFLSFNLLSFLISPIDRWDRLQPPSDPAQE